MGEKCLEHSTNPKNATEIMRVSGARIPLYKDVLLLMTLLGAFLADQISKLIIKNWLLLYESWPASGLIRITHGTNSGTAFGLFPDQTFILIIASFLAIGFLVYFYRTHSVPNIFLRLAVGLQLGGAFGNLIDRVRFGEVVDFIRVGWWPTFNLADSAIVIGIGLLVLGILFGERTGGDGKHDKNHPPETNENPN